MPGKPSGWLAAIHEKINAVDLRGADYVQHTKIGSWDFYEQKGRHNVISKYTLSLVTRFEEIFTSLPYVLQSLKALISISYGILLIHIVALTINSLIPAATVYYSSQLLHVIQDSLDSRSVDKSVLFRVLLGRITCAIMHRVTSLIKKWTSNRINTTMRSYYAEHILLAHVRLDVPTFHDPVVRDQLLSVISTRSAVAWAAIEQALASASVILQLITQLTVLVAVVKDQPDGTLLACLSFADPIVTVLYSSRYFGGSRGDAFVATCKNEDYLRFSGLKSFVGEEVYRKELVAGNLANYIISEFRHLQKRLQDEGDLSYEDARTLLYQERDLYSLIGFVNVILSEMPQLVFTFRAVRFPRSIPVSIASLDLVRQTATGVTGALFQMFRQSSVVSNMFHAVGQLHEMMHIENKVVDGTEPYPEDARSLRSGIAIEFIDVSFRYPGTNMDTYAIKNVSFRVEAGQLCVLVGFNGSGKSTILKLINRLYDPTEGTILIDGRDIKTLKLADLRDYISCLFQDYTHFPLSVKENIGMGDPRYAKDEDRIRQAAELGGASDLINELPRGFDTYITRPTKEFYTRFPGQNRKFDTPDYSALKKRSGFSIKEDVELSGGQMQKLAVSRTFMKSLGDDSDVGLLLFDEPSASLDPTAEFDLFERLRRLRGSKTMVFSSHRYGQLTKFADLILFMANSTVVESGTHEQLLKLDGGYAKMYNIQASQFQ